MSTAVETGGDSSQLGNQLSHEPALDGALPSEGEQAEFEGMPDSDAARPVVDARATPHGHGLLQACQSLLNIIVIALFIITFTVQPFRIPSESMEPTLLVGDFLLVNKDIGLEVPPRVMAPASTIHRGDLIVFHYPVDSSLHLVKRVIGLPGDRIHLRDGQVYHRRPCVVRAVCDLPAIALRQLSRRLSAPGQRRSGSRFTLVDRDAQAGRRRRANGPH